MSKNPTKPGMTAGKPASNAKPTPTGNTAGPKGTDPKHLPREFKYFFLDTGINS